MKKFLLSLIVILSLASCRNIQPISDPFPPSVESQYYNGELVVDGVRQNSLSIMEPSIGSLPSEHTLSIYGAHEGDLLISSRKCGIDKSYHYSVNEPVTLKMSELMDTFKQNCFFTIVVSPFYKDWDQSEFPLHSYMMGLYVRVKPENFKYELKTNRGKFIQLREATSGSSFPPDSEGPLMIVNSTPGVRFAAFNCLSATPLELDVPESGQVDLDLDQLHKVNEGCLVQLKDKAGGFTPFIINVFKHDYVPLSEPSILLKGKKLEVVGSEFVTLTNINGAEFYGGKADIDFESGVTYIVRQYTIKGRNIICEFKDQVKTCWR
jgi:hypothetical protein